MFELNGLSLQKNSRISRVLSIEYIPIFYETTSILERFNFSTIYAFIIYELNTKQYCSVINRVDL